MIDESLHLIFETLRQYPVACAHIEGNTQTQDLTGDVFIYPFLEGTLVAADVEGIPFMGFYGFHIHQHGPCIPETGYTGFYNVGTHYNPSEQPHPYHAGDLPVLMSFYGHAFMIVYTDRFKPEDVIGRAMIIHEYPDDYKTQPTGAGGRPIACGTFYPCCIPVGQS